MSCVADDCACACACAALWLDSRYQPVFVLVALCTTTFSVAAFMYQHAWDEVPEAVVASVAASVVLLVTFGLQVAQRFVSYVAVFFHGSGHAAFPCPC